MAARARDELKDEILAFWADRVANRTGITPWRNKPLAELARFIVHLRVQVQDWTELEATAAEGAILQSRIVPRLENWLRAFDEASAAMLVKEVAEKGRPAPLVEPPSSAHGGYTKGGQATWPSEDDAAEAAHQRRIRRAGWGR